MDDKTSSPERPAHRAAKGHRWEKVELLPYREDERGLFKTVSRQILFSDPELASRYPDLIAWRDALYAAFRMAR